MFRYNAKYDCNYNENKTFYICPWIQHGLVFFKYKITHCCYCGHNGGGHTLIRNDYNGHKIDWKHLFKLKSEYTRLAKKGFINDNCVDCPFLTELCGELYDSPGNYIDHLYISHWTNCNCRCTYCYATQHPEEFQLKQKQYSVLHIIQEMLDKNILRRGGSIHFGGGEPTLLPEFEAIIELLLNYKFYDIRIHTSGIEYSPMLERGIHEGRVRVVLSVDAGCEETYNKIKQVPLYNKVRENAKKYAASLNKNIIALTPDFYYEAQYCVNTKFIIIPGVNDTIEEVENWIKADVDAGICTSVIDLEENWFKEHENNIPQSLFDFIHKIKLLTEKYGTHFELYERVSNMLRKNPDKAPWFLD